MKQVSRNKDTGNFMVRYGKSFCHAINGIGYAIRYEHNLLIIIAAIVVVTMAGIYFQLSSIEWLFCTFTIGLVVVTELVNSAIEAVCDALTTKPNPLIKIAKDTASGASLISCIVATIVGMTIFIPKIVILF